MASTESVRLADTYVVVVRHNLVTAVRKRVEAAAVVVPETKLEVGTQLADNYRNRGCIDGDYFFHNAQRAHIFATLCLEFTKALAEKRLEAVKALTSEAEYDAAGDASAPKP